MASNRSTFRNAARAFTLIEVLVAAAISLMLALVLVMEYTQSATAVDMATARVEMSQLARLVVDRITPYVSSGVMWRNTDPIVMPIGAGLATEYVIFNTTEDFLDPAYDPANLDFVAPRFFAGDNYPIFTYIVWFEDDAAVGPTDIDQLPNEGNAIMLGRLLAGYNPADPWPNLDAAVTPRALVHSTRGPGRADGADLVNVEFRILLRNALDIRVTTEAQYRESHGNTREAQSTLVTVLQLSSMSVSD